MKQRVFVVEITYPNGTVTHQIFVNNDGQKDGLACIMAVKPYSDRGCEVHILSGDERKDVLRREGLADVYE